MSDEPDASELSKIPFKQKDAWEWAFRAGLVAAFFYLKANFVPIEKYERDLQLADAKQAIVLTKLDTVNNGLVRIDEDMKQEAARDQRIDKLDERLRTVENRYNNGPHP